MKSKRIAKVNSSSFWGTWLSRPNFISIHLVADDTFHSKPRLSNSWCCGSWPRNLGLILVGLWFFFSLNPSNSCWEIFSPHQKWWTTWTSPGLPRYQWLQLVLLRSTKLTVHLKGMKKGLMGSTLSDLQRGGASLCGFIHVVMTDGERLVANDASRLLDWEIRFPKGPEGLRKCV